MIVLIGQTAATSNYYEMEYNYVLVCERIGTSSGLN